MPQPEKSVCPYCNKRSLERTRRDYIADIGDGQKLRVPNIEMEFCNDCGEEILSLDASREIQSAIEEHIERLPKSELTDIRESFGVDQTEMSEALGLGGKTYHRWEKGSQYPSRSMGYYLRVLREFPQAFEWLKARRWRGRNRITSGRADVSDLKACFPDLARQPEKFIRSLETKANFAHALLKRR